MKTIVLVVLLFVTPTQAYSGNVVTRVGKRVADTDWLSRTALKYGFVVTVGATNALRMAVEADRFDGRDLLGADSYHAINLLTVAGYVASGYLLYAVMGRDSWTWRDKAALVLGTLCLARESGELTYQGMRHGNPFNSVPAYHRNEFPWFESKPTFPWVRDDFKSTGRYTTPLSHAAFTAVGLDLVRKVR